MKKFFALILIALVTAGLFACSQNPTKEDAPETQKPSFTAETLPRLDGSTATIPLSEGIVKALLSYDASQAQAFVKHNTTHYAYENLIGQKCDVIFVTPPSDEEYQLMKDSGREYEVDMVVKDAFVFLVNKENPVDNISVEDLQKIYKGEITNWKDLGGSDAEITAFQRPDNSGSQTLMYKLLVSKDQISQAPEELKPAGMGDLVDAVSSYDEGLNSIGYSVFYYASGMYTDPNSKMISVGGVYPTLETVSNGSYPLVDGYYAVYDKSLSEDSSVRQLISWLKTDDGQKVAADEGYVPLRTLTK
ncbi:MAG: substrate-binding domain-containing protein [Clostridiaceae bacterium]|nr:substrate-binding domain-containing protein [Clostridiaceae bacterium]